MSFAWVWHVSNGRPLPGQPDFTASTSLFLQAGNSNRALELAQTLTGASGFPYLALSLEDFAVLAESEEPQGDEWLVLNVLEHVEKEAEQILHRSGYSAPQIPPGCHTNFRIVKLQNGHWAAAVNQTRSAPAVRNCPEPHDLCLFECLDQLSDEQGPSAVTRYLLDALTVGHSHQPYLTKLLRTSRK